jgi:hypothetical protein
MMFRVIPLAQLEVNKATWRYDQERAGLGERFLRELDEAYTIIQRDPTAIPLYEVSRAPAGARRQLLKSFPYLVIFRIKDGADIIVIAVHHVAREPGYWRNRQS